MKKLVAITAAMAVLIGAALGQEYKSRLPTPTEQNRIAGVTSYIQDELLRSKTIRALVVPMVLSNYVLNAYNDGVVFFIAGSNTVVGRATLPNPTNNLNRRYELTLGTNISSFVVTNNTGANGFQFWNVLTTASTNSFTIPSNGVAYFYSTGTNWIGYTR